MIEPEWFFSSFQLIAQRRLTPQQQMILQQKWAHQQSANRQIGVQRLQTPHQQIQLTQQQRLHLPNQQIQISQGQPVINQQIQVRKPHPNQQMPVVHKRLPAPNQQIQISRAQMQQLSNQLNTQGQIPPNQLVRKAQIANVHMNLQLQQQASHQRLQLLQHSRQTVPSQQMSVNEQTQMNQQKNVPLYQLVAQQQVSGTINQQSQIPRQLNQQSQIASQLPQQVRLSGPRPQVHSQINQPPQIHGQVNRQPQVSGQIPQQPRIPTQVGQPPEMSIQVSQQSQIPIQVSQRPQILTQVSQQPQIPNQISQQPQIPNQVNQRPQIPTLPNQMSQRPPIPSQINQRPQIPTLPAQMGQRPQIPSQMSQRPQIPTLPTQMNQRPQLPSQMSQRPQIPSQMSQRPQIPSQMSQRPQMPSQMSQRPQIPPQVSQQPQILTQISQQTPVTGQINQPLQAPRQLNPQQRQILWQQQRPQGRVVIQQGSQPAQGLRQVPFDVQQQGQNQKLPQGLWQQKQMILANQQRQVANRMQLAAGQQRMVSQQNVPTHPPPPYPGKANQPTEPPQAFREVTQQQTIPVPGQQIINVNSAGQIVTPKTKTALANLLNTRLQTGNISPNSKESTENISLQAPMKVENSRKKEQVAENSLPIKPAIQLYGHDFDVNVPPSSCLLGCTFCICDYESPTNKVDMWKKIVLYHGGEVEPTYSPQCTHVICESTKNPVMQQALREAKRCISAFWLNDVIIQRNMIPPWKAVHIPSPCIHDKPCKKQIIAISGFEGNDRKCLQEMILISGARYTGHLCQSNTLLIAKKNDGQKFKKATEWRIPVVSVQWLNDILSGHYEALRSPLSQKYQNYNLDNAFKLDYTNIHHLMFAWRSPVKVTEAMLSQNSQSCNKLEPPSKRIRLSSESGHNVGLKPRIMFSGIKDVAELTNIVIRLGGSISTSTRDCTHLVIKTVIRTVKLFLTISTCEFIVTVDWLLDSSKQNKFLEEDLFIPDNPQAEAEMGFNIKNTLKRKDRSLILKGFTFYVTPSVPPSYNVLCLIIENNSGKVVKKPLKINEIKATNKVSVKYVIISTEDDIHLCQRYITNGIDVYNPEVVLTGIMNQNFDLEIFKYKLKTSATGQRIYDRFVTNSFELEKETERSIVTVSYLAVKIASSDRSQLQMILNSPLTIRCHDLSIIVKETYFKERQNVFPILLDEIFGTSGNRSGIGWGIGLIQQSKQPREFQCVEEFLSPKGPLLSLCYKLMIDGLIHYEFDIQNLPIHTRQSIDEGVIPAFYTQKLKNNPHNVGGMSPGTIVLTKFKTLPNVRYVVDMKRNYKKILMQLGMCWTNPEDYLYPRLLDDYLKFYMPFDGSEVPSLQEMCGLISSYSSNQSPLSSTPLNSPQLRKPQAMFGLSPLPISSPKIEHPLLKNILPSPTVALSTKFNANVSANRQENWRHHGEVWCSETIIQIFVEFWLNQVPLSADRDNSTINFMDRKYTTHADHVHIVRILTKHIHFFANSIGYDIQTSYSSFPHSNLDHLKKNVYPNLIQKKLYYFLRHSFDHWPLDASFRVLLELWLSAIQPWRYCNINTNVTCNVSDLKRNRGVDKQWEKFIAENILFYSSIFRQLVPRLFRMDLTTLENSFMFYRIMHVFSQPNLCTIIKQVESCLCDSPVSAKYDIDSTSNPILSFAVRQSIAELEGPGYKYNSLMEDYSSIAIPNLVSTLVQAIQVSKESVREVQMKQTSFWQKIYVFFGGNGQHFEDEYVIVNSQKVENNLTSSLSGLCQIFNLPEPSLDRQIEQPSTSEATSIQFVPGSSPTSNLQSRTSTNLLQEENFFMTTDKKRKIINGLVKPKSINYQGNPDLQPIRSYECAFLVRQLYVFSCLVNVKFGDKMKEIYDTRQDFLSRVLKSFLEPPNVYYKKDKNTLNGLQETEFVPPRISLRCFANYQNIGYLCGLYLILYVFGFGLFSFLMLVTIVPLLCATIKTLLE
ncbi:PAX-interacting protein 1 [Nymphon striatum]|nr:PAX-interacting protein 1 [Nymphon striatum]